MTAIIGLSLAWWVDHHQLAHKNERLRSENFDLRADRSDMAIRSALAQSVSRGERRVRELFDSAKNSSLLPNEAEEVLFFVQHDSDPSVRVRAMAILPYLRERERAVDALIDVLRESMGDSSTDGVIPQYAAKYLAQMKARRAVEDVEAWLSFLKSENPYDEETRSILVEAAERDLAELILSTESQSPR